MPVRKSALFFFGLVILALVSLGLVVLSSASGTKNADPYFFLKRQVLYLLVALAVVTFVAMFDYRRLRERWGIAVAFYVGVLILLWAVFAFPAIKGSQRWIPLGPINLQPSELAKLAVVIATSLWMDKAGWRVELFKRGAFAPASLIGILAVPVMLEPDFGSVMVMFLAGGLVMIVAGTRILHLLPFAVAGAGFSLYRLLTNENRLRRLEAFFQSASSSAAVSIADQPAAAYQANQSLVAIHNGGLWGMGLGESMQKNHFLPEAHTDFIFAIGAEEFGIVFSIAVIVLFLLFFAMSVYFARRATDRLGRYLVIGMSFIIFFQAMFNLGVVCEALPTKGMALPFFSYGGTNLIATFFEVGIILSVGIHSSADKKRRIPSRRMVVKS